jgi:CheY-like chemotaxis protein
MLSFLSLKTTGRLRACLLLLVFSNEGQRQHGRTRAANNTNCRKAAELHPIACQAGNFCRFPPSRCGDALEHHPDLILLELDLTDMDGLEFVSLLKEKPQLANIPIVAMSIFSYLKSPAVYGGCDDFLQKPVKMIELVGHIRRLLREASVSGKRSPSVSGPVRSALS